MRQLTKTRDNQELRQAAQARQDAAKARRQAETRQYRHGRVGADWHRYREQTGAILRLCRQPDDIRIAARLIAQIGG